MLGNIVDSSNLQAPIFSPMLPVYPHLMQELRLIGTSILGPGGQILYFAHVQQTDPSDLISRDRELCLVTDANSNRLNSGYYIGRLCSQYNNFAVYKTYCCTYTISGSGPPDPCNGIACTKDPTTASFTLSGWPEYCCVYDSNGNARTFNGSYTLVLESGGSLPSYIATDTWGYGYLALPVVKIAFGCVNGQILIVAFVFRSVTEFWGYSVLLSPGDFDCCSSRTLTYDPAYSDSTSVPPQLTLNVTFNCTGSGSGTGSGTGSGGNPCSLPDVIHITIANVTGCACMAGTYALTWTGSVWYFTTSACGQSLTLFVAYIGGNLQLTWECGVPGTSDGATIIGSGCTTPFSGTGNLNTTCCTGSVSFTVST